MSEDDNANRTIITPSRLPQGSRRTAAMTGPSAPAPPAPGSTDGFGKGRLFVTRLDDDIPQPALQMRPRNPMIAAASRLLAMAAALRSGRSSIDPAQLKIEANGELDAYERSLEAAGYGELERDRASFAICATIDDIVQNLPGHSDLARAFTKDALAIQRFRTPAAGDEFWEVVRHLLARPAQQLHLIELYHACIAAGFEGRYRNEPDGGRRIEREMNSLYAALEHVRSISAVELSPEWRGSPMGRRKVGFWSTLILAAVCAGALLLVVFVGLQIALAVHARPIDVTLDRFRARSTEIVGDAPHSAVPSAQLNALTAFLAYEIAHHQVAVEEDQQTVRVRTTDGEMFASGSANLNSNRFPLISKIGEAIQKQADETHTPAGPVVVEGYTDDQPIHSLDYDDNVALSKSRAETVARIVRSKLKDASQVTIEGRGEALPIAPNDTREGRSLNRRVEIVVPRRT